MSGPLPLTYVLPLRAAEPDRELGEYVRRLAEDVADVVVVDGSDAEVRAVHERWWRGRVRHVRPDPARRCANGKVHGVLTGLDLARFDHVVIADDDVRWDRDRLGRALAELHGADLVAPANHYAPLTWPARYDTARTLLHRALGADWPGTLVLRRSALAPSGGAYDGDVLFENLELVRTVEAAGGRVRWALDLFVPRRPPTTRHFLGQRVRQAYDELARPAHLLAALAVVPLAARTAARGRWSTLLAAAAAAVGWAEAGRRRAGGRAVFPAPGVLFAPLWVVERGVCAWLAVLWRVRGGVPYAGGRLRRAASTPAQLRRRVAACPYSAPASLGPSVDRQPAPRADGPAPCAP